jgi:diaminopimelate decarboxylase
MAFHYLDQQLHVEAIPITRIVAEYGSPCYIYSLALLHQQYDAFKQSLANAQICYAVKANSNLAILTTLAKWGAGFDIVSGGELARVLAAGANPAKVVFSGVGKQDWEMQAALEAGVKCFNVESVPELKRLSEVATRLSMVAAVSLRVNPDVDAQTHPYISTGLKENKFGIAIEEAPAAYQLAMTLPGIQVVGVDCHIGSQITEVSPYLDALDKLLTLIEQLVTQGITLKHLDLGGGLGIRYDDETPLAPNVLLDKVFAELRARGFDHLELVLEPGRSLDRRSGRTRPGQLQGVPRGKPGRGGRADP